MLNNSIYIASAEGLKPGVSVGDVLFTTFPTSGRLYARGCGGGGEGMRWEGTQMVKFYLIHTLT